MTSCPIAPPLEIAMTVFVASLALAVLVGVALVLLRAWFEVNP